MGQAMAGVKAIARDRELTMLIEPHRARVLLPTTTTVANGERERPITARSAQLLEVLVVGADRQAAVEFGAGMTGVSRYFRGADAGAWLDSVSHHDSVRFIDVYPGIDLVYRLRGSRIEYDFLLDAGADPGQIALEIIGADDVELTDGNLIATTGSGELRQHAPEVFRVVGGAIQPVAGEFRHDGNRYGFAVAADDTHEIIIDPVIEFSTYLGGSADEFGPDIAVNPRGNLVVNGVTRSLDIPGAPGGYTLGGQDIFVAEIDRDNSQLLWIAFIGGSEIDFSDSLSIDSLGNVIAVGYTASSDFPTVNAFQAMFAGSEGPASAEYPWDGVVVKLNDDGSQLVFSTYYGGVDWNSARSGFERLFDVEVDGDDRIYVVGQTAAPDFPVTSNFRGRPCMDTDGLSVVSTFVSDVVLIEFAPDGTREFATCIGGTERDAGSAVALGADGATYVGGYARSSDLPVSIDAFQTAPPAAGEYTPFVLKLNLARTDLEWGTYFGGSDEESLHEFAVGNDGSVYAAGTTLSEDFPVTLDALQPVINAGLGFTLGILSDAFVVKLRVDGTDLDYATYFGGAGIDDARPMRIDDAGRVYFAGGAASSDLLLRTPLQDAPDQTYSYPVTLAANGTINALATAEFGSPFRKQIVMARNGVNQFTRALSSSRPVFDFDSLANDTRDVIAGDYSTNSTDADIVFIEAGASNNVYVYDQPADIHILDRSFGDAASDSRAAAPLGIGGDLNIGDVVVGNYGAANEIFLDADGVPTLLGRPDGNTVDVVTGNFSGTPGLDDVDIVFANEGQDIRLYRNTGATMYSSPILLSTVSPDVSAIAAGDIDGNGTQDLIIGNSSGPLQVVRDIDGSPGAVEVVPGSSADTRALWPADFDADDDLDLFVGNDGPDRLYLNDGNGNFTVSDEFPAVDGLTLALVEDAPYCCFPFAGGPGGLVRYRGNFGALMVGVIDPDTGTLEFATYLEGNGSEFIYGLTLDTDGDILIAAANDGDAWPQVGAVQAGWGGRFDAVLIEIDIDIDDDGVIDGSDNCLEVANPAQRDTDNDAYGNFCDPDLNDDGAVNFADLVLFKERFFGSDPDADLDGDGIVSFPDLQILKKHFFGAPGPSGLLLP